MLETNIKYDRRNLERILNVKFSRQGFYAFLEEITAHEIARLTQEGFKIIDFKFQENKPSTRICESLFYVRQNGEIRDISYQFILKHKNFYQEIAIRHSKPSLTDKEKMSLPIVYKLYFLEKILNEAKNQPEKYFIKETKEVLSKWVLSDIYSIKEKRIRYDSYTRNLRRYYSYMDDLDFDKKLETKRDFLKLVEESKKIRFVDTKVRLLEIINRI